MKPNSEFPYLEPLLQSGRIVLGSSKISAQFNDYIVSHYPWAGSGIHWNQLGSIVQVDAGRINDSELGQFFDSTTLSQHALVAVIRGASRSCILVKYSDLATYFDELVMPSQTCYVVGLSVDAQEIAFDDFVEMRISSTIQLSGFKHAKAKM